MRKIAFITAFIMLLCQCSAVFAADPAVFDSEITIVDSLTNKIRVAGPAAEGSIVSLVILNPGFTEADIAAGTEGAVQFFRAAQAGNNGYAFDVIIRGNAGDFTFIVTVNDKKQATSFNFIANEVKEEKIDNINAASGKSEIQSILPDIIETYRLNDFPLYANASSNSIATVLFEMREALPQKRFPLNTDDFYTTLKEAVLLAVYNAGARELVFSEGELLHLDLLEFEGTPVYKDLLDLTGEGRDKLINDILGGTSYYSIASLKSAFESYLAYYLIKHYKDAGYGHIGDCFTRYRSAYAANGFNMAGFASVKSKTGVYMELLKNPASNIGELAALFNNLVANDGESEGTKTTPGRISPGSPGSGTGYVTDAPQPTDGEGETQEPLPRSSFADLSGYEWAAEQIEALFIKGVISGRGNGIFAPSDLVTRAEFVKMVVGAFEITTDGAECGFEDIIGEWSYPFVAAAVQKDIVNGISEKEFAPHQNITREQAACIVYRALSAVGITVPSGADVFDDSTGLEDWSGEAVHALKGAGIISGKGDNLFFPKDYMTRAEAAKLICGATDAGREGK